MAKVIMLVGLPASGKSTRAKDLAWEEGAVIISSDTVREEMYGDTPYSEVDNSKVFEEVNSRIVENLENNVNVIYDATNTNRKRRIHFIDYVVKGYNVEAYYFDTPFSECIARNMVRKNEVPYKDMVKMYENMHVPSKTEGFSNIVIYSHGSPKTVREKYEVEVMLGENAGYGLMYLISLHVPELKPILELPHDSTYHSFSVSRHIYYVYDYIHKHYNEYDDIEDRLVMLWSAILHDVGKAFCKKFVNFKGENTRYAHFKGHENVSAQIAINVLKRLGYNPSFCLRVADMVQFHMMPHNTETEKAKRKLMKLVGEKMYEDLMFFNKADNSAK